MKVFITDLEAYNNGHLVGEWYKLPMSEDLLAECIENVLQDGRRACGDVHHHEEHFITDFDCDYMDIEEYANLTKLNEIAELMEGVEEEEKTAIKILIENGIATDLNDAIEKKEDLICTGETKMEDIAYNHIEETGALQNMPESLLGYFDYEKFGRDMEIEGSYFEDNEGVFLGVYRIEVVLNLYLIVEIVI